MTEEIKVNPVSAAFAAWAETPDYANAYDWLDNDKDAGGSGDPRRGSLWGAYHAGWMASAELGKTHLTFTADLGPVLAAIPYLHSLAPVIEERRRQVEEEGWTAEHDATHINGELALAAACYLAHPRMTLYRGPGDVLAPELWPWDWKWWKPGGKDLADYQRRLVKGIALGLAELDRVSHPDFVARHAAEVKADPVKPYDGGPFDDRAGMTADRANY